MLRTSLCTLLVGATTWVWAQAPDTVLAPAKDRYVVWFTPSSAAHIHGVAVGPIGSEHFCSELRPQVVNGIGVQLLGGGLFSVIGWKAYGLSHEYARFDKDSSGTVFEQWHTGERTWKTTTNGVLLSAFGTFAPRVHGLSIGGIGSIHDRLYGVSVNVIRNTVYELKGIAIGLDNRSVSVHGLQIGLFNRTYALHGLQIGLWNRNAKRALPFINWGTGKRPR